MSPARAHAGRWAAKENGERDRLGELGWKEQMGWEVRPAGPRQSGCAREGKRPTGPFGKKERGRLGIELRRIREKDLPFFFLNLLPNAN
jgi:hypothetical protein